MCKKKFLGQLDIFQIEEQDKQFQQNSLLKLLIKKIEQVGYNLIQNIILPSKYSIILSSRNQIITGIVLDKIGISANIISIIILFL